MRRKSNSQVTIAYQHIRDRIISYTLAPGTQISDNSLAKELDMSRAPIREAILLLQMDGLVQLNDQGTMIVSPLSINDVVDILHIRSALESESILLISAGGWLSAERENEMIEIHRQLSSFAQQDTSMNHYMYDDLFHSKLAEYSGSPRICELLGRMRLQMQRARWLNLASPNRLEASVKEHDAILSAILHHEQDECIRLLRLHLKNSETALRSILQDKQIQALAMMVSNFCNQD